MPFSNKPLPEPMLTHIDATIMTISWWCWKWPEGPHCPYQYLVASPALTPAPIREYNGLAHWGRVTHICIGNLTIIGSYNGLSPGRHQAIIQTNAGIWGGWGSEVSCDGHHRPRRKTTTGSALDGAVFDITQILAYLVHNMSRSQSYLGFGHFGWLPSFFGQ